MYRMIVLRPLAGLLLLVLCTQAKSQQPTADGVWGLLPAHSRTVQAAEPWIRPEQGQALEGDMQRMAVLLSLASLEDAPPAQFKPLILELPDPYGRPQQFRVLESPIMEPGLAAKFPEIKTYVGQGLTDPAATLRADITPQGFHAQVLAPDGSWYIDPYSKGDSKHYTSYFKRDLKRTTDWSCGVTDHLDQPEEAPIVDRLSGPTLRTYRLACACTGEYASFHGGTVTLAQAAIVTAINRVTGVYEVDLGIRFTLVANNSSIVFTNSTSDPYSNSNGGAMLSQNQSTCDGVIMSANYDIGHVFSTGGGGIAGLGVVCGASKANGVTGSPAPTGDAFWIDYVAHEMGHQCGGNHTFNSGAGSCAGNRNGGTAYEIGSGTTIMAYAGICSSDDVQAHSDAYFSFISIQEINSYMNSGTGNSCSVQSSTGNSTPTVTITDSAVTIPKGTPFMLTASGTDPNGDALTYCWEERDTGTSTTLAAADNGTSPIIRSRSATTSPTRFVPRLPVLLAGSSESAEKLPAVARAAFRWRVTVRDNRAGGGGVNSADVTHVVNGTAGPFTVTSQSSATNWVSGSTQTISWNVAGTTANGVNCANVAILFSTDGGNTYPITLLASTPNDGSETITVPNNPTTTGRIMVKSLGNIFFNINSGVITLTAPSVSLTGTGTNTVTDTAGNGNSNGRADPGETAVGLSVLVQNTGTTTATSVSGTLTSLTPTVSVTTGSSSYPNLAPSGGTGTNTTQYVLNVGSGHPCGDPINLRLTINSAQGSGIYDFAVQTGVTVVGSTTTVPYSGPAVAIPDNNLSGANASVVVSGISGNLADVNFRFDGSACTATAGATTVGLDHSFVGDLTVTLTSPLGTSVVLMDRAGGTGNGGNNLCNTILDDEGSSPIQSINGANAPFSGTFIPNAALSAFDGQSPNGTWVLTVVDNRSSGTGNIRAFSLVLTTATATTCDPPVLPCTAPSITGNPMAQTVCAGAGAGFTVSASGTTPSYQWRKDTMNIGGATSPTYMIAAVSPADVGSYDCVVTNGCGTATCTAAALNVNTGPTFTGQPTSQAICTGQPVTFTVGAGGSPAPMRQWRKNTMNIGGATGLSYTIPAVSAGDAATYDCVITNSCGSATSDPAVLTEKTAPSIGTHPTTQAVCPGQPLMLSVGATGTATLTYQWRKNTVGIGGANSPTYSVVSAGAGDAGSYDCVVTNSCGSATSNAATVTISSAPSIGTHPATQAVCTGQPLSLSVGATGTATLTYQWRKDTMNIGGATSPTYGVVSAGAGDAGSYDCVVTNSCGTATSNAATVTINSAPSIGIQPSPQSACSGQPASFAVSASGVPTPTYQWRVGGSPLAGQTSATLSFASVTGADAGNYDCVVTNSCGSVTSNAAALIVNQGPVIMEDPQDASGCVGGPDIMLTVTATGTPTPTYSWTRDNVPVPSATTATLLLTPGPSAAGSWCCTATNSCGSATSLCATVTIADPATVTDPASTTACPGSTPVFGVTTGGTAPVGVQWQITDDTAIGGWANLSNGTLIRGGQPVFTVAGATLASLQLSDWRQEAYDAAFAAGSPQFRAVATNTCLSVASNGATLTLCSTDFNCSGNVDSDDLFDFLDAWFAQNGTFGPVGTLSADFNASANVDSDDLFSFLDSWFAQNGACP